ncbi:putative heart-specific myosin light chain phosphatase small subunit [Schistosoma mansoni]|uniref:putative heart-specific myosin light chain phosphatase small subunit n=1 Tax=Schistosoma mansoni TaxID=6183 RepID=UPI0001A63BF7|nr:putative heart-specific myosin light chain phosphatase small subunit [Schistosoma mansoni]|eukprot:XP_018653788.1 putative heart-specific myosin light chain phosphatase small subunit [Schistosoma mansoni]
MFEELFRKSLLCAVNKGCITKTDTPKPSRYLTRTQGLSSNSGSSIGSVGVGSSCSATGTSTSSYSGLPQYPRRSPNKISSNTNYTVGGIGTSSSWNSDLSSAASKTPNYKQLYEEEKILTNGLREEVKAAQKELKELEDALENSVGRRRPSEVEQRKMERRISECEQELKLIDKLRAESEKLHAEHRALIRVVSRLNREQ